MKTEAHTKETRIDLQANELLQNMHVKEAGTPLLWMHHIFLHNLPLIAMAEWQYVTGI